MAGGGNLLLTAENREGGQVVTIERVRHSGAYVISQLTSDYGYLFTRTYYGYTRAQAIAQFRVQFREEGK